MKLPTLVPLSLAQRESAKKRLLICCDGFEARGLSYTQKLKSQRFDFVIIVAYKPSKKSNLEVLLSIIRTCSVTEPTILAYNRFDPVLFEFSLVDALRSQNEFDEIEVDISVMSKLLILLVVNSLKSYEGNLRIIYTEPEHYAPSEQTFVGCARSAALAAIAPSVGVRDVVRTPGLSSLTMQRSPSCLVAFTSFNEQLVRALLYSVNPARLILIGSMPPIHKWRAKACQEIHKEIIREYSDDNQIASDGFLSRRACTLDYRETVDLLRNIYNEFGMNHRIFLAPTGSKMQALGCALAKIEHDDIHVEYPTPESFIVDGYSSENIRQIHEVSFSRFCQIFNSTL